MSSISGPYRGDWAVASLDIELPSPCEIAGVEFDLVVKADVLDVVLQWRHAGRRGYITLTNPHSVMMCRRDDEMHTATACADLTLPDGVGVILAAKLLGYGRRHRVTGPDLMLNLCDRGREVGLRHFFYGGGEGVALRLVERFSAEFPGIQIAGTYCPAFNAECQLEEPGIIERINQTRPDVVWVGLGAPKQEKWMLTHAGVIDAAALIGVGAAFDFHSGNVKWAPGWMRRCGLEWAYRLLCEPRRMWRRNLDSPLFLATVLCQAAGRRLRRAIGFLAGRPQVNSIDLTTSASESK